MLGESGTEQFEVVTRLDEKEIGRQKIHDPFITTTVTLKQSRWELLRELFRWKRYPTKLTVHVSGSHAATRAIMQMDCVQLERENRQWESGELQVTSFELTK